MAVDPKKLIAAINPDVYCKADKKKDVKEAVKQALENNEKDAYLKAAEKAELADTGFMDFDDVIKTPFKMVGLKNPLEQHSAEYESTAQALEQVYYYLHDYLYNKAEYGTAEKLVDSFIAAPGSSYHTELAMKGTRMQEEGMKIIGLANQTIRTIINLLYDLKEWKLRLALYDDFHNGKDQEKKNAAYLSLKQIWMDQVDIKRGNTSIKALAMSGMNQPGFVMLIDAFMSMKSLKDIAGMENERVKRVLEQRFSEFERWLVEAEKEQKKRFEIEKTYLKSQVNAVKLYSRWAKPYLRAAAQVEQKGTATTSIVTAFNVALFELTLLGIGDYKPETDVARGELPPSFKGANKRKVHPVVLVELKFRTVPERFQQGGYGFRGKAEVTFTSFALNEDERRILKEQLEWDDFKDVYSLVAGTTDESLGQLQVDIDEFLGEEKEKKEKKSGSEEVNPFSALVSVFSDLFKKKKEEKKKDKEKSMKIEADSEMDKVMRSQAGIEARRKCRKFYDSFKKSHDSPAF